MIRLYGRVPNDITVACSGGPDSMAVLDFFRRGRKGVTIAHFDHGTEHAQVARSFVESYARREGIPIHVGMLQGDRPRDQSLEEWWSGQRNAWFQSLPGTVVTGHNLDDALEWWLYTSMHGRPRLIPHSRDNVIRPMLLAPKAALEVWCERHDVPYVIDPSNLEGPHMRTIVRRDIVPHALQVNPGLHKVVRKLLQAALSGGDGGG